MVVPVATAAVGFLGTEAVSEAEPAESTFVSHSFLRCPSIQPHVYFFFFFSHDSQGIEVR